MCHCCPPTAIPCVPPGPMAHRQGISRKAHVLPSPPPHVPPCPPELTGSGLRASRTASALLIFSSSSSLAIICLAWYVRWRRGGRPGNRTASSTFLGGCHTTALNDGTPFSDSHTHWGSAGPISLTLTTRPSDIHWERPSDGGADTTCGDLGVTNLPSSSIMSATLTRAYKQTNRKQLCRLIIKMRYVCLP